MPAPGATSKPRYSGLSFLLALNYVAAAPSLDPDYFAPSNRVTGLLYANPTNTTCEVLLSTTEAPPPVVTHQQASAAQASIIVNGNLTLQVETRGPKAYETGFDLVVELPIATIVGNASNAEITRIAEGSNSTVAYSLSSRQRLKANGQNSVYINATIVAVTQDFIPRNVYLNGTRCALALRGLKPSALPPTVDLSPQLGPVLANLPPLVAVGLNP